MLFTLISVCLLFSLHAFPFIVFRLLFGRQRLCVQLSLKNFPFPLADKRSFQVWFKGGKRCLLLCCRLHDRSCCNTTAFILRGGKKTTFNLKKRKVCVWWGARHIQKPQPHSHSDGMRDLPPWIRAMQMRGRDDSGCFPLGHVGVALDRMATNRS